MENGNFQDLHFEKRRLHFEKLCLAYFKLTFQKQSVFDSDDDVAVQYFACYYLEFLQYFSKYNISGGTCEAPFKPEI